MTPGAPSRAERRWYMKRFVSFVFTIALILSLAACGSQPRDGGGEMSGTAGGTGEGLDPGGVGRTEDPANDVQADAGEAGQEIQVQEGENTMCISVEGNGQTIIFELNDSQAAVDLYGQMPISLEVENFSDNEKIFYPPRELDTSGAPLAEGGAGTLAYYAPWGDVVMFYDAFGRGRGLYELGRAVSGEEKIETLSGTIEVSAIEGEE